jgi:hypothetical protein
MFKEQRYRQIHSYGLRCAWLFCTTGWQHCRVQLKTFGWITQISWAFVDDSVDCTPWLQIQTSLKAGSFTSLNLLDALSDRMLAINIRFSVAVAYIDYVKAFDTVSLITLCHKLRTWRIIGNLLVWSDIFSRCDASQPRSAAFTWRSKP